MAAARNGRSSRNAMDAIPRGDSVSERRRPYSGQLRSWVVVLGLASWCCGCADPAGALFDYGPIVEKIAEGGWDSTSGNLWASAGTTVAARMVMEKERARFAASFPDMMSIVRKSDVVAIWELVTLTGLERTSQEGVWAYKGEWWLICYCRAKQGQYLFTNVKRLYADLDPEEQVTFHWTSTPPSSLYDALFQATLPGNSDEVLAAIKSFAQDKAFGFTYHRTVVFDAEWALFCTVKTGGRVVRSIVVNPRFVDSENGLTPENVRGEGEDSYSVPNYDVNTETDYKLSKALLELSSRTARVKQPNSGEQTVPGEGH